MHNYYDNKSLAVSGWVGLNGYITIEYIYSLGYGMTLSSGVTHRSKLPDVGTSVFSAIGQLSAQHNAIDLAQGTPNFSCDAALIACVNQAMLAGHNQYAPLTGHSALKEALAEKVEALYGQAYDPASEILITAGASEGLYAAITGLVHAGDEVIFFEPAFDSYAPVIRLQGATPIALKLNVPQFTIDWDALRAAISPRTRMIIINTPHSPTGQVLNAGDLAQLAALTRNSDIIVLSDEMYEHLLFDGRQHHGMATHPELAQRSVIVSSFGETFHVTGWRVGYCLAPAALMAEVVKVHQFLLYAADTPMQAAFAHWLREPFHYHSSAGFYQQKRDLLASLLQESPFELLPTAGAFFMLASYRHFSEESDSEMVKRLIIEHGVATIPLSPFYSDGTDNRLIRLSFAKDEATLQAGAQALCLLKTR